MAIAFVQSASAESAGTNTATPSLSGVVAGNTVVLVVSIPQNTQNITTPTGYTLDGTHVGSTVNNGIDYVYHKVSAGGTEAPSVVYSVADGFSCVLAEFTGGVNQVDVTAGNDGGATTGTALDSGTTATTTHAAELAIGVLSYVTSSNRTLSTPTNGFTQDKSIDPTLGSHRSHTTLFYKVLSATGTQDVGATLSAAQLWSGLIVTLYNNPVVQSGAFTVGNGGAGLTVTGVVKVSSGLVSVGNNGAGVLVQNIVRSGIVQLGNRKGPGGGLVVQGRSGDPTGHWVPVVVLIWRDNPRGSGTNFAWGPVTVKVWRKPGGVGQWVTL